MDEDSDFLPTTSFSSECDLEILLNNDLIRNKTVIYIINIYHKYILYIYIHKYYFGWAVLRWCGLARKQVNGLARETTLYHSSPAKISHSISLKNQALYPFASNQIKGL